jgi:hypothetical protein
MKAAPSKKTTCPESHLARQARLQTCFVSIGRFRASSFNLRETSSVRGDESLVAVNRFNPSSLP